MAALTPLLLAANGSVATPAGAIPQKMEIFQGFGIACLLNISEGASLTATVQVTNDPNFTADPASCRWNNHDSLQNLTASQNSSVVFPIVGMRLVVTNWVSGSAQLQIGIADYQN